MAKDIVCQLNVYRAVVSRSPDPELTIINPKDVKVSKACVCRGCPVF